MLGAFADRVAASSARSVTTVGSMLALTGKALAAGARPPYSYGNELVAQCRFTIRLAWLPMAITSLAISYGPSGIQAANLLNLFGALDRLGGLFVLAVIREFAPLVCAIVIAGVAGTAICADLGARKIREELDALMVLGVDPVKSLVVPRLLALTLVTGMFDIYALIFGTFGGVLVTIVNHAPVSGFFATYFNNASTTELAASLIKASLFGAIIAVVCCYKGLTASGGAEGVGRAVNQAVVIAFLAIGAVDYVFTQTLLATHPELSSIR
jgi:phospholipid/cholesterol/gamma-HCH transport system permease protein